MSTTNEPEAVFRMKSLDTNSAAKFLLTVYMPMPFGVGKHIFSVDELRYDPVSHQFRGELLGNVVVSFPDTYQYLLITRDNYDVIPMEEAKKLMAEAEEEDKKDHSPEDDKYISPGRFTYH